MFTNPYVNWSKRNSKIFSFLFSLIFQVENSLSPVPRLYCLCVCCSDGVHWYSTEDEAKEALQFQTKEGHLCHHRPHVPCVISIFISDIQPALLDCSPLYQVVNIKYSICKQFAKIEPLKWISCLWNSLTFQTIWIIWHF